MNKYFIFILILISTACSKLSPAGFWVDFHKEFILTNNSDQGPWGGSREIHWKHKKKYIFNTNDIIEFANNNGWKLIDSLSFSLDTISDSSFSKLKNDDYSTDIMKYEVFSKLKLDDRKLLVFQTTWMSIEPGNARETFENGFVVLNSDGTEMSLFHFWGE